MQTPSQHKIGNHPGPSTPLNKPRDVTFSSAPRIVKKTRPNDPPTDRAAFTRAAATIYGFPKESGGYAEVRPLFQVTPKCNMPSKAPSQLLGTALQSRRTIPPGVPAYAAMLIAYVSELECGQARPDIKKK